MLGKMWHYCPNCLKFEVIYNQKTKKYNCNNCDRIYTKEELEHENK